MTTPLCSYWHSLSEGGDKKQLKVLAGDQEYRSPPTTTTTTNISAFNDTNSRTGIKNPYLKRFVWVVISIPHWLLVTITLFLVTTVLCVCATFRLSCCRLEWGAIKNSFVKFCLWIALCIKLAIISYEFVLGDQIDTIKKWIIFQDHMLNNAPRKPSKSLLRSPSRNGEWFCSSWPAGQVKNTN